MLKPYEKVGFVDHVVDQDTGEVVQQGTPLSRRTLGHMDDSLSELYDNAIENGAEISALREQLEDIPSDIAANAQECAAALQAHDESGAAHQGRIRELEDRCTVLGDKIQTLEDTFFSDIKENPTYVFFDSPDSVELIQGNYNAALQRIECTKGV